MLQEREELCYVLFECFGWYGRTEDRYRERWFVRLNFVAIVANWVPHFDKKDLPLGEEPGPPHCTHGIDRANSRTFGPIAVVAPPSAARPRLDLHDFGADVAPARDTHTVAPKSIPARKTRAMNMASVMMF